MGYTMAWSDFILFLVIYKLLLIYDILDNFVDNLERLISENKKWLKVLIIYWNT